MRGHRRGGGGSDLGATRRGARGTIGAMGALVIFDDGRAPLSPATDLRAVFELRTGAQTTLQRLGRHVGDPAALLVPAELEALVRERAGELLVNELPGDAEILLLSGRCVLPPPGLEELSVGEALVDPETGEILGARLTRADAERCAADWSVPASVRAIERHHEPVLRHVWDLVRHRDAAIADDLRALAPRDFGPIPEGAMRIGSHPVCVDSSATVLPACALDSTGGPISIGAGATIRPGAILCGPCAIGRGATVVDRAHIKANTAIGPFCKVGGEVGGTIFQSFSNKSHDGHLGDSWIGEWVNVGAGTTNSNLLNTYGEVAMKPAPASPRRRTGMTFLGAIVGDHVKFAILARIMTGSVFGTGAMVARSSPPTTVAPFGWMTDGAEEAQWFRWEKFIESATRMMARRDVAPSDVYLDRLRELHRAAAPGA